MNCIFNVAYLMFMFMFYYMLY